jgi:uncharacterized protein (TIGR02118 family)
MFKISVMYPNSPDVHFDHDYYRDVHMPLVKQRLGDGIQSYTVDKGIAGGAPGSAAPYVSMCHLFAESLEAFQSAIAVHGEELNADIPHFTNAVPVHQISEVVVDN